MTTAPPSSRHLARHRRRVTSTDHLIGFALAAIYVAWLIVTARSLGFPRDEAFYFRAGQDYERWFELIFDGKKEAFEATADSIFSYNHEHPPLLKDLFGLSFKFLHEKHHVFEDASTAFRFPGMCMGGLTLWVTYLFGARAYGRWAGFIAAVLLGLMPRVFFNAHLACFDVGIMAMCTLTIYVYWRATAKGGLWWALAAGVVFGLTLLTKHNSWILPFIFVPHAMVVHARPLFRQLGAGRLVLPTSLVAMATIGPVVFYNGWPWLWHDPVARVTEYVKFHLNHEYYNMEFLGRNYNSAPSPALYMPVMILATVPAITLALFLVGAVERQWVLGTRAWRLVRRGLLVVSGEGESTSPVVAPLLDEPVPASHRAAHGVRQHDHAQTDLLFFLALAAPLAVFLLPKTPIFGGTKHWLTAYPFLALFAGRGFVLVGEAMNRAWPKLVETGRASAAWVLLAVVVTVGPLAITEHSHPFGLSSYVPLVGGTAGGADLGLNRQFWGFTTQSLAPWLAAHAPRGASVYIHDTVWDAWNRMIEERRLPANLRAVGSPGEGDFAIVHHELHMGEMDDELWVANGSDAPAYVLAHDGVPIISVYQKRR